MSTITTKPAAKVVRELKALHVTNRNSYKAAARCCRCCRCCRCRR